MMLKPSALANSAGGQEWTKPFLLQMSADGADAERTLTFRTLGANVAASIKWSCADTPKSLPEAVLSEMRSARFECPFKPVRVSNLRLIKPDGALLDVGPDTAPLADNWPADRTSEALSSRKTW